MKAYEISNKIHIYIYSMYITKVGIVYLAPVAGRG